LKPDRPEPDRPAAFVVAQQHSSAICVYLRFSFPPRKIGARFKNLIISAFITFFLNLLKADSVISDCVPRGVSAHSFCLRLITLFLLARGCS
jgi:hypothetical protein